MLNKYTNVVINIRSWLSSVKGSRICHFYFPLYACALMPEKPIFMSAYWLAYVYCVGLQAGYSYPNSLPLRLNGAFFQNFALAKTAPAGQAEGAAGVFGAGIHHKNTVWLYVPTVKHKDQDVHNGSVTTHGLSTTVHLFLLSSFDTDIDILQRLFCFFCLCWRPTLECCHSNVMPSPALRCARVWGLVSAIQTKVYEG